MDDWDGPGEEGLNGYTYCGDDPVNYVDPTGEIPSILAGGIAGGVIGGISGFAGSAISQLTSGEGFSFRKAAGSAMNGLVVGAVKGALVGSGAGIGLALTADFTAGTVGSALEQWIGTGKVSVGESVVSGITNAISGAVYGNGKLDSMKEAVVRGMKSGALTSGVRSLYDTWKNRNTGYVDEIDEGMLTGQGSWNISPYAINRDPRSVCGVPSPYGRGMEYGAVYGYQYEQKYEGGGSSRHQTKKGGFSLWGFTKDVLVGAVIGGVSSAAFYKAGKALEALKGSIKNRWGNKDGSNREPGLKYNLQFFANESGSPSNVYIPMDADGNPIPLRKQNVNGQDIPLPAPNANGSHTVLGGKVSSKTGEVYRQSATFPEGTWPTANGQNIPWSEVHWTDHGTPHHHTNPHQHIFKYNPGKGGWFRNEPTSYYP